jgi:hypothetical protein
MTYKSFSWARPEVLIPELNAERLYKKEGSKMVKITSRIELYNCVMTENVYLK